LNNGLENEYSGHAIEFMKQELQKPITPVPEPVPQVPAHVPSEADLLRAELAEQIDLRLRLAADLQNFKRRTRLETETRAAAQKESFILELLPVIDNLERALAGGASPSALQFHQGVDMTLKQLHQILRLHGIETTEILGQPFDPRLHEAISQRCDKSQPDHTVLEVFQRGYSRGDRIIRPAKVVVNNLTPSKVPHHAS
jgi:molecular chaperone GrpE